MIVIFDLDGTLIDSARDIQSVAGTILGRLALEPLTLKETQRFIGEGAAVFVQRMMAARALENTTDNFETLHNQFLALYETALDKAVFYPNVLSALEQLSSKGHVLGLCTNKPEKPARAVLEHMGLSTVFDSVIAGGMCDTRKPDPEMLQTAIKQAGGGASLYVGDSEIDAMTAERATIPFALFSGGYRKKPIAELAYDWVFDDFSELPAIVEAAQARQLNTA